MFPYPRRRRILRRAVQLPCHALRIDDQRVLAGAVLDLSPHGMLAAVSREARVGETLLLSFPLPDGTLPDGTLPDPTRWLGAKASVARVIRGRRNGDPELALGMRFTDIPLRARLSLWELLEGRPPPVPSRPIQPDYAGWVGELIARGELARFPD